MKSHGLSRRRRLRRRDALKLAALMLPALFWSIVFAKLAGAHPFERVADAWPDAARVLLASSCTLLAVMLCVEFVKRGPSDGASASAKPERAKVAAGVAFFVFVVLASLSAF